jgi:hypothetical protein
MYVKVYWTALGIVDAVAGVKVGVVPQVQTQGRRIAIFEAFHSQDVVVA